MSQCAVHQLSETPKDATMDVTGTKIRERISFTGQVCVHMQGVWVAYGFISLQGLLMQLKTRTINLQ